MATKTKHEMKRRSYFIDIILLSVYMFSSYMEYCFQLNIVANNGIVIIHLEVGFFFLLILNCIWVVIKTRKVRKINPKKKYLSRLIEFISPENCHIVESNSMKELYFLYRRFLLAFGYFFSTIHFFVCTPQKKKEMHFFTCQFTFLKISIKCKKTLVKRK